MSIFMSRSVFAVAVVAGVLLGGHWAMAASPGWSGATTTNQPRIQQPRKPLVSEPEPIPAQTVQPTQPRSWTSPGATSRPTGSSTPVQQRVSQPTAREAEIPMSIAQDECVLFIQILNPDPLSGYSAPGTGSAWDAVTMEAAPMVGDRFYIKEYVVLEKGDYQVMYLPDLLLILNINKNNSVEFLVRLPGINLINRVHADPDDWTKGKKSRITLGPGEKAEFDHGSAATLIKVRCP